METTLLKNKDWESIDGKICLVTGFVPMAKVDNGSVVAVASMPYASVRLRCERSTDDITGFIAHKIDFLTLRAAFNERTAVSGTRVGGRGLEQLNAFGVGESEEVWLVWTRKRYRGAARFFNAFLPRLIVMVSPKGAFELMLDRTGIVRPDLKGEARALAGLPLATWTPAVMKE